MKMNKKIKSETDIQLEICKWLESQGLFFWRFRYMSRFPIKFLPRGLPDIMILHEGKFITMEVKVPDYWKYTDNQKEMGSKLMIHGGAYHLVTSLGEAMEAMAIYAPNVKVI